MLAHATAQGNDYTAEGDREDKNFELYNYLDQYSHEYEFHSALEYVGPASGVPPFGAFSALGSVAHVSARGC